MTDDITFSIVEEGEVKDLTLEQRDLLLANHMIWPSKEESDVYHRFSTVSWRDLYEMLSPIADKPAPKATHVTEGSGGSGGYAIYGYQHYVIHFDDGTVRTTQQWFHSHGKNTRKRIKDEYGV